MSASMLKGVIRNGRVEVEEPIDLPDGTEVTVSPKDDPEDGPLSPAEIARVLTAMRQLDPLDIPPDVAADLDAWEHKLNQHGIANSERT